ncbi:MAG: transposase [Pseudomonadota bacterium]
MTVDRRRFVPGRTHFFTARLYSPACDLLVSEVALLRDATRLCLKRWPFEIAGAVILPNQMHMIWVLPDDDIGFSRRWGLIKSTFARHVVQHDNVAPDQSARADKGVWQRRLWHHVIRDGMEYDRHMHLLASAPVQAGLVKKVGDWPYSSFVAGKANRGVSPARTIVPAPSSRGPSIAARAS